MTPFEHLSVLISRKEWYYVGVTLLVAALFFYFIAAAALELR